MRRVVGSTSGAGIVVVSVVVVVLVMVVVKVAPGDVCADELRLFEVLTQALRLRRLSVAKTRRRRLQVGVGSAKLMG